MLVDSVLLCGYILFATVAAAVHVLIFYLESCAWEGPLARKVFGGTVKEARTHAFYAFNQGFYNLFLAIQVALGLLLQFTTPLHQAALALSFFGLGSMLTAAIVLASTSPQHRGAALKQGAAPALALVCMLTTHLFS